MKFPPNLLRASELNLHYIAFIILVDNISSTSYSSDAWMATILCMHFRYFISWGEGVGVVIAHSYNQNTSQIISQMITNTFGSTSIKHRYNAEVSDWCLINVYPRVFAMKVYKDIALCKSSIFIGIWWISHLVDFTRLNTAAFNISQVINT